MSNHGDNRPKTVGEWRAVLLPLVVLAAWLAGEAVLVAVGHPAPCAFRLITGIPCPTCGATRATLRLLHLDLGGAWAYNPFVTVLLVAGPVLLAAHAGLRATGRRGLPPVLSRRPVAVAIIFIVLLLANWAYVLRAERARGTADKRNRVATTGKARMRTGNPAHGPSSGQVGSGGTARGGDGDKGG